MRRTVASSLFAGSMLVSSFVAFVPSASAQVVMPGEINGAVKVSWAYRGGSCQVRYTETNEQYYKYRTEAGCDEGSVVVQNLVPGQKYRFSVSQNGNGWSRPVVALAKNVVGVNYLSANQGYQRGQYTTEVVNGDGWARLMWAPRDGQYWVRYTEADQRFYKYATTGNAMEGQVVIGQLVPGRRYRFQVSVDSMNWSAPIVLKARRGEMVMPIALGGAYAAPSTIAAASSSSMSVYPMINGAVRVAWNMRGGTCNIRYTEVGMKYFKYRTSAGCDEASTVISGLIPGRKYKFEVAQDSWSNWSAPVYAVAR